MWLMVVILTVIGCGACGSAGPVLHADGRQPLSRKLDISHRQVLHFADTSRPSPSRITLTLARKYAGLRT